MFMWSLSICSIFLNHLDTKKYPVFNITKFYKPENINQISSETILVVRAQVLGSTELYKNDGDFEIFMEIENEGKNTTVMGYCLAIVSSGEEKTNLTCLLDDEVNKVFLFQNIYLLPYYYIYETSCPFEVYIQNEMKASDEPEPDPKPAASFYLVYSQILIIAFLLLL